jgi:hypothetical protein
MTEFKSRSIAVDFAVGYRFSLRIISHLLGQLPIQKFLLSAAVGQYLAQYSAQVCLYFF